MPSVSKAQHALMLAVVHGLRRSRNRKKKLPPVRVAKEFLAADKRLGRFQGGGR